MESLQSRTRSKRPSATMQIPVLLQVHKEISYQKGDEQDEVPNITAKPHLSPKAQEEFHQQHKLCLTDFIMASRTGLM